MFEATNAAAQSLADGLRRARVRYNIGVVLPCGPHRAREFAVGHLGSRQVLALARQAAVDENLNMVCAGLQFSVGREVKALLAFCCYARGSGAVPVGSGDRAARSDEPGRFGPTTSAWHLATTGRRGFVRAHSEAW